MTVQEIIFDTDARARLKIGVDKIANAVKVTLGAKGRNVIIDADYNEPQITKDGVTVARSINLEDPIENMGARLIKSIAHKTNEMAGDGTTTATVLAQAIFTVGLKNITAGANPMDLKKGIDKAIKVVVEELKRISKPIGEFENMKRIATISANGDEEIGSNITEAIKMVSKDGVITIQEATSTETTVEVSEGMQFNRGYLSPYFVTDTAKMEVVLDNPIILLASKRISLVTELLATMEIAVNEKRPLIIITEEIDSAALQLLIINKVRGSIQVAAVKSPNYGAIRKDQMQDIAILTGGFVIDENVGMKLEEVTFAQLGKAEKIIINQNTTTIVGGKGDKEEIKERVELIRGQIKVAPSEFDAERIRERLAKMAGGVAVIYVGGGSEVEMKERKDRFDDALNATKAAIDEGIVPGGGVALLRCIGSIDTVKFESEDEKIGGDIIRKAIEEPFRRIMSNAGQPVDVILNGVMDIPKDLEKALAVIDHGFNVATEKFELFFETGVIDPTKVVRVALENAASVAGLLLTTECVIWNVKKEETKND